MLTGLIRLVLAAAHYRIPNIGLDIGMIISAVWEAGVKVTGIATPLTAETGALISSRRWALLPAIVLVEVPVAALFISQIGTQANQPTKGGLLNTQAAVGLAAVHPARTWPPRYLMNHSDGWWTMPDQGHGPGWGTKAVSP